MANHKSALKRIRSNETKRNRNRLQHKTTRNAIKDFKQSSKKSEIKASKLSFICAESPFSFIKSSLSQSSIVGN